MSTSAPQVPWGGILDENEQVLMQMSKVTFWPKESYGSTAVRSTGGFAAGMQEGTRHAMERENAGDDRIKQNQEFRRHMAANAAIRAQWRSRMPGKVETDFCLVTNKRLLLVSAANELLWELSLDPAEVRADIEGLKPVNQEAVDKSKAARKAAGWREKSSRDFMTKTHPTNFGAVFAYPVLRGAEKHGRMMGGTEMELKIDVLNLSKRIEGLGFAERAAYGAEAGQAKHMRGYGLKFAEENRIDELVNILNQRSQEFARLAEEYK